MAQGPVVKHKKSGLGLKGEVGGLHHTIRRERGVVREK